MDGPPPPPPPHGANPGNTAGSSDNDGRYRSSTDLPDGPYDIFVIPPHSSGSGFLYLPSLKCHRNSFLAGVAAALVAVALYVNVLPVLKSWFSGVVANGGMGVFMLVIGVAVAGWAFGKTQSEAGSSGSDSSRPGTTGGAGTRGGSGAGTNTSNSGGQKSGASFGGAPNHGQQYPGGQYPSGQYTGAHQHYNDAQSGPNTGGGAGPSDKRPEWDKSREDTQRKEEIRRKMEEFRKKRKEEEEKKKEQEEKEAKEQQQKREKEAREREFREWKEKRAKEKAEKEAADKAAAEKAAQDKAARSAPPSGQQQSSQKKPPFASVKTAAEDDAYSFRPYDRPRPSANKTNPAPSIFSESLYSQSTARTTPPPSRREPYTTKDPDKVIINGVYSFNNTYMRTPVAQLVSGQGHVTDGLIMRITTEGMFVDDDVRGIAQREWDIKAWTLKVVEV